MFHQWVKANRQRWDLDLASSISLHESQPCVTAAQIHTHIESFKFMCRLLCVPRESCLVVSIDTYLNDGRCKGIPLQPHMLVPVLIDTGELSVGVWVPSLVSEAGNHIARHMEGAFDTLRPRLAVADTVASSRRLSAAYGITSGDDEALDDAAHTFAICPFDPGDPRNKLQAKFDNLVTSAIALLDLFVAPSCQTDAKQGMFAPCIAKIEHVMIEARTCGDSQS